ncbi:MAG: hypothetical protein U1D30_08145 [Planctomycetota bacterium]
MAFSPVGVSRVSFQLNQRISQDNLRVRQQALTRASTELSTGRRINLPSDDPSGATRASVLQLFQAKNQQFLSNVAAGTRALSITDQTLRGVSDAVDSAVEISVRNAQSLQSDEEINADISQVDAIVDQMLRDVNQKYLDRFTFAGQRVLEPPFQKDGTGIVFKGDNRILETLTSDDTIFDIGVTPNGAIGTDSLAGRGTDLNPDVTLTTRLADLNQGQGVTRGVISVDVGGGPVNVDLGMADSIGDVINLINDAVGPGSASLNALGNGIRILGAGPITVQEIQGGTTAQDLGILTTASPGPGFNGMDLNPQVTLTTPLAALNGGLGVKTTVPFKINNGPHSAVIDISAATTVEDVLNSISSANVRVRAEINDARNGINVVNVLAGSGFEIVENALAGTAAEDLGILTTNLRTPLSEFNDGTGIRLDPSGADISITLRDGTTQAINLDGAKTLQDVKNIIEGAFGAANVSLTPNPLGGVRLTDLTGGAGNFVVANINNSKAATDLGIESNVASSIIYGNQTHLSRVKGVFDSLLRLREGLANRDLDEIEIAGQQLDVDRGRVLDAIGSVGSRVQVLDNLSSRITAENERLAIDTADVLEPELAQTITDLLTQQNALQAALSSTSILLSQSLLDFL